MHFHKPIFISFLLIVCVLPLYVYYRPTSVMTNEIIMSNIMSYQMPHVLKRCQKDFGYTNEAVVILEQELKRFLILCAIKENVHKNINMYSADVDNLWHSFILFTKEYASFCNTHAGHFIHHNPRVNDQLSPEEIKESRNDFKVFLESYEKIFKEELHPIWLLDRFI